MWLAITCCVLLAKSIGAEFLRDCHTTDPKPYIHFATRTPYELINNEDSSPIFVAGCKPVMFWMVARHGTQYPPSRDVFRMKDRLPKLRKTILQNHKERRGTLCQQDVDGLSNNGSIRIDDDFDEKLTATGREELLVLARRFRGRFADFFNSQPSFNTQDYQFRHIASSLPSQSSARSFSRGIFTNEEDVELTEAPVDDRLVHFFENCTRWREELEEQGLLDQELNLFHQQSTSFQNTLADVTTRLGFQYNMSAEDMLLIYDVCRYQKAWNLEQISPWCAAFTSENLKVLEFGEDLETYSKQGYGHELNYHQSCPLVKDLVTRIRAFRANNGTQRGLFYFTEGDGLLRLIARMGLAKDEQPLTHDTSPLAERKWRTSLMGSFAANIAVVLYNCSDDFKIQVFVKEDVVHLDQCQNALCTAKEFLQFLGPIADQCDNDDGCNSNSAVIPYTSSNKAIILILVIVHSTFH